MGIAGIDGVTYGVEDVSSCRKFWRDWGLKQLSSSQNRATFATLDGGTVEIRDIASGERARRDPLPVGIEPGIGLRKLIWGVSSKTALKRLAKRVAEHCTVEWHDDAAFNFVDPLGLSTTLRLSQRRRIDIKGTAANTIDRKARVDEPATVYDHATPAYIGHVVLFVPEIDTLERFYCDTLGFVVSDRYPNHGVFLRRTARAGHHDLFLLKSPHGRAALNHIAFVVRDIHEVFGGGLHVSRCGWETQIGPGRHPISSAYFWYVKNPCGGLVEYFADEDHLTERWRAREFTPSPELFAEWAVIGGIDGTSRRAGG